MEAPSATAQSAQRSTESKSDVIDVIDVIHEVTPVTQNRRPPGLPPLPAQDLSLSLSQDRRTGGEKVSFTDSMTPLSAAFRFVEPTWRNYIMYVDMEARTGNEEAKRYLACWQALSHKERLIHRPEQVCELATVSPSDLVRWVAGQAWAEGAAKSSMCMSFMRDRVLEKTAEFAMASPDNYKHADLFMRSSGLLPSGNGRASGPAVTIFNSPMATSNSVAGVRSESAPVLATGLRDMDTEVVELSKIMQNDNASMEAKAMTFPDDEDDDEDPDDDDDDQDGQD